MAQSLSELSRLRRKKSGLLALPMLVLAGFYGTAMAQNLQDPTRPADAVLPSAAVIAGESGISGPVLQSVLIGPTRKIAVIDGQAIALNGLFGDQVLIRIEESEVVLRRGKTTQTLKLFPDFEKKNSHKERKHKNKAVDRKSVV